MSSFDDIGVAMIPSGYKEDKLYSVLPNDGDGDFDFSRATSATRVNSEGLIEIAKVLGTTEEITNGDFATNSDWSGSASISSGQLTKTSGGLAYQGGVVTANKYYKVVVDVESLDGATQLYFGGNQYTLSVGVQTIEAVGGTSNTFVGFNNGYSSGSGSVFNSISVIQYIENDVPRLDYPIVNGAVRDCPALLLEPQRTNLLSQSEYFDGSDWVRNNTSVTTNANTSPSGLNNASLITANGSNPRLVKNISLGTGNFSFSWFAKKGTSSYLKIRVYDGATNHDAVFDLDNGTLTSGNGSIINYDNGWYRCTLLYTSAGNTHFTQTYISNTSTGNIYLWGAQIEAGDYPTSYIPTYGTSVTRNAEVCDNSGTSGDFNSAEGVLFVEISALANDGTYRMISLSDGTATNRISFFYQNTPSNRIAVESTGSGTNLGIYDQSLTITNLNKIAVKYKANDCALWVNGIEIATDTSFAAFSSGTFTKLSFDRGDGINDFYGKTKQLITFKEALTDAELETLTSWASFSDMALSQNYIVE